MKKISRQAQSMIELAIFGAILFFLIAGIASVYLSGSLQQNTMLQSMRHALYQSYVDSENGDTEHASGAYLMYEDRLSGEFGKFGSGDRAPMAAYGSGALTRNQLLTVDFGEDNQLALMDIQVNGQLFKIQTRAFAMYKAVIDGNTVSMSRYGGSLASAADDLDGDDIHDWMVNFCPGGGGGTGINNGNLSREKSYSTNAYPLFYKIIAGNDDDFSTDTTSVENYFRFDYGRKGPGSGLPQNMWEAATWQWKQETLDTVAAEISEDDGTFPSYDVTGDGLEETLYALVGFELAKGDVGACGHTAAYAVEVSTSTIAEWNTDQNEDVPDDQKQGIKQEMRFKTEMQGADGKTYLDIKEGTNLSSNGKPVQVSELKKNQYDVIERVLQLNPYMASSSGLTSRNRLPGCGAAGSLETCFDSSKNRIYIRSRLSDKRGRKWVTFMDQTYNQTLGGK